MLGSAGGEGEAKYAALLQRAALTYDGEVLVPDDLSALISCLPTEDEAKPLRTCAAATAAWPPRGRRCNGRCNGRVTGA